MVCSECLRIEMYIIHPHLKLYFINVLLFAVKHDMHVRVQLIHIIYTHKLANANIDYINYTIAPISLAMLMKPSTWLAPDYTKVH